MQNEYKNFNTSVDLDLNTNLFITFVKSGIYWRLAMA